MSKASPAYKRAWMAYERAKAQGAHPDVVSALWDAVMRALHDTPEPPVGLYADEPKKVTVLHVDKAEGIVWLGQSQSIDDWHDEMMREGGR